MNIVKQEIFSGFLLFLLPKIREQEVLRNAISTLRHKNRPAEQAVVSRCRRLPVGDRLFSEYDQRQKSYSEKQGIIHTEILLPENAPPGYADRSTLWNAVEAVENQWNSQLARRFIMALPRELSREEQIRLIREYCQAQFVSKGMIADFAIHNKGNGNPHAHILLTLRPMDEQGHWLPKCRKEYVLDENGQRIKMKNGEWKSRRVNTVDWNDQKYSEICRHEWEVIQNRYLEAAGRQERVNLRSFERQNNPHAPQV